MQGNLAAPPFDVWAYLKQNSLLSAIVRYRERQTLYAQGDPADSVFYVHDGKIKVTVISKHGKEAVIAMQIAGSSSCTRSGRIRTGPKFRQRYPLF